MSNFEVIADLRRNWSAMTGLVLIALILLVALLAVSYTHLRAHET